MNTELYLEDVVSIITPIYNGERYIRECIESVQKQSYEKWELVIVDDGSQDKSADIIQEIAKQDNRICYYKNDKNMGVAETRNKAVGLAKGRYIAFLDSDDVWKSDKLEKQISFMKRNQVVFCYSACDIINENGEPTGKARYVRTQVDYKQLLKGNEIPCLTVVLDRKYFKDIAMPNIGHEDYATWLKLLQECESARGINEVLASYRVAQNSLSGNKFTAAKWTWYIYREYLGLSFMESVYSFITYALEAIKKRI